MFTSNTSGSPEFTNRSPAAHFVAGANLQEATLFLEPRTGPRFGEPECARVAFALSGRNWTYVFFPPLCAMSKEKEFSRVSEGNVHPALDDAGFRHVAEVVHKTIMPCNRDSAGRLYAALSQLQSSFLFRPSAAYSCASLVNTSRLKNCCKRLLEKGTSWEVQCSCVARQVSHEFPRRPPLENTPEPGVGANRPALSRLRVVKLCLHHRRCFDGQDVGVRARLHSLPGKQLESGCNEGAGHGMCIFRTGQ